MNYEQHSIHQTITINFNNCIGFDSININDNSKLMKTIQTQKIGSKIYVDGYRAYYFGMTDCRTVFIAYDKMACNTDYVDISRCDLLVRYLIMNEFELVFRELKKTNRFIKAFCRTNKEFVKGIIVGAMFIGIFWFAFKFMM